MLSAVSANVSSGPSSLKVTVSRASSHSGSDGALTAIPSVRAHSRSGAPSSGGSVFSWQLRNRLATAGWVRLFFVES